MIGQGATPIHDAADPSQIRHFVPPFRSPQSVVELDGDGDLRTCTCAAPVATWWGVCLRCGRRQAFAATTFATTRALHQSHVTQRCGHRKRAERPQSGQGRTTSTTPATTMSIAGPHRPERAESCVKVSIAAGTAIDVAPVEEGGHDELARLADVLPSPSAGRGGHLTAARRRAQGADRPLGRPLDPSEPGAFLAQRRDSKQAFTLTHWNHDDDL